jgi:hypothetical protein
MEQPFPIIRHPLPGSRTPVLVSVPHYGTQPLPHITRDDYVEPRFETFAYGFADTFAGDLYGDLHEHGATVLATPQKLHRLASKRYPMVGAVDRKCNMIRIIAAACLAERRFRCLLPKSAVTDSRIKVQKTA